MDRIRAGVGDRAFTAAIRKGEDLPQPVALDAARAVLAATAAPGGP